MPIARRLALDFEQDLSNAIGDRDLQADVTFGPIRALISRPVSRLADTFNKELVKLSDLGSLTNVDQFSVEDLDDVAYNYQILRGDGTASAAVVSLLSSSPPTSNVTIPINFPFSTDPDPDTGAVVFFASTEEVVYIAANANNFYDAVNRVYRLDVPVQAVTVGEVGSIGPNRITRAQRAIGGFQRVTNFAAATPGSNAESNEGLANTLLTFNLGINDISTPYGIGLEVKRQFPSVIDYRVVFGADTLLTRASEDAGATDIYLIAQQVASQTESFTYDGFKMQLSKQPLISIISVSSGPTTFIEGTHYQIVTDTGPYGGSNQGQDAVEFLPTSPLLPVLGATIQISYNYNTFITTIQRFFTSPKFAVTGRSLLFKQGRQKLVTIAGDLTVLPNFDPSTVRSSVVAAILAFVNTFKLGIALEQFDLLTAIGDSVGSQGGVDNFVLTTLNLEGLTGVLAAVDSSQAEYIRVSPDEVQIALT
jgi:hypothetical protein